MNPQEADSRHREKHRLQIMEALTRALAKVQLESCDGFENDDKQVGDYLGMVGNTGSASNGITHLHLEIGVNEYGQPGCDESVDGSYANHLE